MIPAPPPAMKADGMSGNVQGMLRKALESVRRTAAAHAEAMKAAEAAFSQAAQQLAADERALFDEREALKRDVADFDAERGAAADPDAEPQQNPEEEEEVQEHMDEEEQPQQEGMEEEEPPAEDEDDEGDGSGRRKFDRERSRSRRRSPGSRREGGNGKAFLPRPVPQAPPANPADLVQAAIIRLGLDENATRQIQLFPPEQALTLLEQVGDGVRNPSAFVTTMCNRTLQDSNRDSIREGPPRPPSEYDRLEGHIAHLGLDESATRVLHELSPEQALNMVAQIDDGVRNPSAFIMSLANRVLKGSGGGGKGGGLAPPPPGPSLPELVDQGIARLRLDDSATRMLHELAPEHALDILDQIGDDVRNPSAFVTAEVRKVLQSGPRSYEPRPPTPRDLSQQVANLAKALELDNDCLEALLSISTQEAVMILERLANTASNIRNRSAFVFAEVKKRKQAAAANAPPRHGPTKTVLCKFWAEGRCKNGSECRFAHD